MGRGSRGCSAWSRAREKSMVGDRQDMRMVIAGAGGVRGGPHMQGHEAQISRE